MTKIIKSFYVTKHRFGAVAERFFFHHPYVELFTVFIGMPIFILGGVAISTTVIILPLSLLLGWL